MSSPLSRNVAMETLEGRLMLAGDVTAVITSGGDLLITGDSGDNAIAITVGLGGEINIAAGDADTTINGGAAASLTGLTGDVLIRMRDGSDSVSLTGLTLPGRVRIDGGRGNNTVLVDTTSVTGDLTVKNLMGTQAVSLINGSSVGGNFRIVNAQRGDTSTVVANAFVTGKLHINNKDGADGFILANSTVDGAVMVNNHKGNSQMVLDNTAIGGHFYYKSMKGVDVLDVVTASTVGGKTKLALGDSGAQVNISGLTTGQLQIQTGKGADTILLDVMRVSGSTLLKTGAGNDEITITNTGFPSGFTGAFKLDMGQGNDTASISADFAAGAKVSGGRGTDSLTWQFISAFAVDPVVVQVEAVA